jgi:porin
VKAFDYFCVAAATLAVSLYTSATASAQIFTEWPWDWSDQPNPAPTQALNTPPVDHLFGDWGGLQTKLLAHGVNLQVNAVSELAGNVSGGTRQGATFANQVGIDLDINWERMAGIVGFSTHGVLVNRSGSSDSTLFGDRLLPVQEIYGSGGDVGVHFVSLYGQETLLNGRLDLAAGRMNVETAFASSPLYCSYMNNDLCGDPKALPGGDIGHSAYPDAVWAARLRLKPSPQLVLKVGVYEVNQGLYTDEDYRTGFKFNTFKDSGVYVPVEAAWTPTFGSDRLPGHYKLGAGYDTSPGHQDFGNGLAAEGAPGFTAKVRSGATQVWALADQMLVRNGKGGANGLIALGGYIHNDSYDTAYARQYFAGFIDAGFWAKRPKDSIAVLMTYVEISPRLGQVQTAEEALDLPISNSATGRQTHEAVFEANYKARICQGVSLQPDFQYVFRPNAQANIPDAAVFGARASVDF